MTPTVFTACFMGQGGLAFSWPVKTISDTLVAKGIGSWLYQYTDFARAIDDLNAVRGQSKLAVVGYSRGVEAATLVQSKMPVDLLISIAPSTLVPDNLPVSKTTKRSVLIYGSDFLSSDGQHGGYDEKIFVPAAWGIPVLSHLVLPWLVINDVVNEVAKLKGN